MFKVQGSVNELEQKMLSICISKQHNPTSDSGHFSPQVCRADSHFPIFSFVALAVLISFELWNSLPGHKEHHTYHWNCNDVGLLQTVHLIFENAW